MPTATKKKTRCWPGYEPVPGKKQHEQGSCRPKAKSKSTPSEKKFQNKRRAQLDRWQKTHRGTRRSAAQHLHAPGTRTKTNRRRSTARKRTSSASRRTK